VSTAPDMEVIGEAENGRNGIEKAIALQPDVIIMDLNMPILTGLEATQSIRRIQPGSKIIMFTANHERSCVQQAADAGAIGFIFKPARKNELLSTIRAACAGQENLGELQSLLQPAPRGSVQLAERNE
jgi:DNA-binding NarL/FixJ family response regulator